MSVSIGLRAAVGKDVEFLARVVLEANATRLAAKTGWDREAFAHGLVDDAAEQVAGAIANSTTYVIEADGHRVGRLRLVRTGCLIEIAGLQILPVAQNNGIGTVVADRVTTEAAQRGVPVELDVEDDNPDALRLYLRLGFHVVPAQERGSSDRVRLVRRTDLSDRGVCDH